MTGDIKPNKARGVVRGIAATPPGYLTPAVLLRRRTLTLRKQDTRDNLGCLTPGNVQPRPEVRTRTRFRLSAAPVATYYIVRVGTLNVGVKRGAGGHVVEGLALRFLIEPYRRCGYLC
jgi:hypothetical protein